jgi:hypothetical protein
MPSNFSASLRFELQFTGENLNSWGDHLNSVISKIDYAIAGLLTLPVTTNVILSTATLLDDQSRAAAIKFTGAGGFSVTIPSVSKTYLLMSTATAPVIVTTGAGSTVQVDNGDILWVICDGTNVLQPGYGGLGLKAYISAAALGASGSLPAVAGNAGKYVYTDGSTSIWQIVVLNDLTDWPATKIELEDLAASFALNL